MGWDLHNPLIQIKITSVTCSSVAITATLSRLYIRRGRYWWDDGWALFSLLCLFAQIAAVFMHVPHPSELSKLNRVAAYYLLATCFYGIIWAARLSILFSVIRLEPDPRRRKVLYYVGGVFILTTIILLCQLFWICEPEPNWKDAASPQCTLNKQVAICQLVSDIIADMILILAPLNLIRGLQDKGLRRRLTLIFSTSVVTTIVSLVHAAYILTLGGPKVVIAALVENTFSLIVANLPVIVAAIFRLKDSSEGMHGSPAGPFSTLKFTNPNSSKGFTSTSGGVTTTTTTITLNEMGTPVKRSGGGFGSSGRYGGGRGGEVGLETNKSLPYVVDGLEDGREIYRPGERKEYWDQHDL